MRRRPYWLVLLLIVAVSPLFAVPVSAETPPQASGFLTGPNEGDPVDIAVDYFTAEAATYGLTATDVAEPVVRSSYVSDHTGVTHVNINQQFDGLEVFGADTTVSIASDGSVVFVGGASVDGLGAAAVRSSDAVLDAATAVAAAADALDLDEPQDVRTMRRAGGTARETVLTDGGISDEPIPARLGWHATDDGLRLAWQLVIDDSSDVNLWNATIDAATGDLLAVEDWTSDNSIDDLVERLGRGRRAPMATAASQTTTLTPGTNNPVDDGSSYRVFALPKESPNDGPRTLVTNPADATASPFGWHDTDGVPGPEFTITRGNNVHAYTDHNNSNSPAGGTIAVTVDPPSSAAGQYGATGAQFGPAPTPAGVSGPLVVVNGPSDLPDSTPQHGCGPLIGFPAGAIAVVERGPAGCTFVLKAQNAQAAGASAMIVTNNVAGAPIVMGGADPTITIPSVMVSLPDGNTIRAGLPATGSVSVVGGATEADGGPSLTFDFPMDLTTQHPHDYWEAAVTNLFYTCNVAHDLFYLYGFTEQAGNFQANNYGRGGVGGDYVRCEAQDGGGVNNANFSTPAADGGTPRMQMYLWVNQTPNRDGDLENGIIFHEYGHGLSLRLTGGPGINCLTGNEQAGEGWSDYVAIAAMIDPALDDPEGPRGMGPYALFQDSREGNGIRPRPYSRTWDIQPFTYDSIKTGGWLNGTSLALPHGLGHGWAAVLWDMTWDLIDKHGFNPNIYEPWSEGGNNLAYQLVIDGLKLQGCGPGLVVARNAIIAADAALTGGDNACTLWASFARRGLGYSAVQGTTNRNDNDEAFDTHPSCKAGFSPPVHSPDALNAVSAGDTVPLRFSLGSNQGLDILASNSPFSRRVDCATFAVPSDDPAPGRITPRAAPINTATPGNSGLSVNRQGVYTYPWKTLEEWAGTCRELVLTRNNGVQHRAYFEFVD